MNNCVHKQLRLIPSTPGVYLFYSAAGELIYVGKATDLKSRVASYFRGKPAARPIEQMIHEVEKIKTVSTDSALEAAIMEGKYIKEYRPKYNIDWKDDKSWNYIVISKDRYPRVYTVREHEWVRMAASERKKTVRNIFGPYPGLKTREVMRILGRLFYISDCDPAAKRPCLNYQLGFCLGVCAGAITPKDYKIKVIAPLVEFLSGGKKRLVSRLEHKMNVESKAGHYEEAGRIRDQIKALTRIRDIAILNKSWVEDCAPREVRLVQRIEGYDISNLGSSGMVGSMVVFDESGPVKSEYRKFKIKSVSRQSDVDCLKEILTRRLAHFEWPLPDLFLIDGGMPQVNAAKSVLIEYKLSIPVIGIAKGSDRKKNEFIVRGIKMGDTLDKWIKTNQTLLIRVRDEAHRFAITFQRSLRRIG